MSAPFAAASSSGSRVGASFWAGTGATASSGAGSSVLASSVIPTSSGEASSAFEGADAAAPLGVTTLPEPGVSA
eukprot:CAMPEP_0179198198 /NCGR_PEP_ID=MMETSP0796-20121207/98576_1 /TAXON_ID=73915 /ORGANISM="Pyrodinium bahamense, Strain pbaha01" /LENGTH=73 /DNA_ID=CAMNT_0020902641 /DNA_START=50 /DNA_END=267 /DNA_ORIENTATION=+